MSQSIINAMYAKLVSVQTAGSLYAAVGGRIYNAQGYQNVQMPYLQFSIVSSTPDRAMDGSVDLPTSFQFDLWTSAALGTQAAGDIEALLYALLEQANIAPAGFDRGLVRFTNRMNVNIDEEAVHIIDEVLVQATAH